MDFLMKLKRFAVGEPLNIADLAHERIPKWKALAVLSSDALSSVAYATEEILIVLCAFSLTAASYSLAISLIIGLLLLIVTLSYQQTIAAYPNGGGAYIVAKENLGTTAGLVAGAALLIDYVLTVAVSVSAGVENIASAYHFLWPHREAIGVLVILFIMLLNLRGIRESASIFAFPTYFFIFSIVLLLGKGLWTLMISPENIHAVSQAGMDKTSASGAIVDVPIFIFLKAFASGCSALTGVEAISNGIPIFKNPAQRNAKLTMIWMSSILGVFFLGISYLVFHLQIVPEEGHTIISLLSKRVFGQSGFYYFTQFSTALILILAANTSYADFPRLASLLAKDRFLPRQLSSLGDRLVFSNGILGLSICAMGLIIYYKGETHSLIPLYAVGVFLSFTLSQAGMIVHHLKFKEPKWQLGLMINLIGAISTSIVLVVIGSSKFIYGAWIVLVLIPIFVFAFKKIHWHYLLLAKQLATKNSDKIKEIKPIRHRVIMPVSGVHRGILLAVSYAQSISSDAEAVYVEIDPDRTEAIIKDWQEFSFNIPLKILKSPFRSINDPLIRYITDVSQEDAHDWVTVIIPEFITAHWWENFLHNQSALFIKTFLMFKRKIVVTSVRYHLKR
jgi:amino acid transporter